MQGDEIADKIRSMAIEQHELGWQTLMPVIDNLINAAEARGYERCREEAAKYLEAFDDDDDGLVIQVRSLAESIRRSLKP